MTRVPELIIIAAACVLVLGACSEDRPPNLPGGGGHHGGGGSSSDSPDASPAPDGATDPNAVTVAGSVCLVTDLRAPTTCAQADLSDLQVFEYGTSNGVAAAADGSFTIDVGAMSDVRALIVAGTGYRTSVVPLYSSGDVVDAVLPVASDATYAGVLDDLGVTQPPSSATIAAYLVRGNEPAAGVRTIAPAGVTSYYDTNTGGGFNAIGPTGDAGVSLMIGIPVSGPTTSFIAADAGSSVSVTVSPVPVTANAVTYLWADVSR